MNLFSDKTEAFTRRPSMDILTEIFCSIFYLIRRICWQVYLLFTRLPPTQAWMDPREQRLLIKYIQDLREERK